MKRPPRTTRKRRRSGLFLIIALLHGQAGLLPLRPAAAEDAEIAEARLGQPLGQGQARLAVPAFTIDDEGPFERQALEERRKLGLGVLGRRAQSPRHVTLAIKVRRPGVDEGLPRPPEVLGL